ncbi:MAG: hypothetical protein PHN52_10010 [candidate division Zixibacteria bacterium]|nr:hypothetical protein [candidate division Zixibacteria bacterium]
MFGFKDISIDFLSGHQVLVWLALVSLLLMSFWLYRRTNPPVTLFLKTVFIFLRVMAVLALCLALLEPVLSYAREFKRSKKVTVLIDGSSSMERVEKDKSRKARLDSLLTADDFARLKDQVDLKIFYFGGNLAGSEKNIDRDRTALGEALYELKKIDLTESSDYWLLFSDGKSNSGRQPVEALRGSKTPLFCVDMSGEAANFDIGLEGVNFNPVVFVGQPTEVKLKLNWHNAAGKNITVQLADSTKILDETRLAISQEGGFGDVTLSYTPEEPGQKLFQVKIVPQEGEETTGNNLKTISVKVLKNRLLILLVTDHPDYEVGFLRRFLHQADKYDVVLTVTGDKAGNLSGLFPVRQADLNRYDLVILHDPDPVKFETRQDMLKTYLSEKGGALWIIMGQQYAGRGPVGWFNSLLPYYQSQKSPVEYVDFHGEPSEQNLFHPVVRLADDRNAIREVWANLPPFKMLVRCDVVDPEGVVLVMASDIRRPGDKAPLLGYRRFGPGKVIASAALPFWSWGFINLGFGEDDSNYNKFLEGMISWLTVQDDFEPVRVTPEKEVFSRGETVRFNARAYDQGFRPLPEVTGTVRLESDDGRDVFEKDFIESAPGQLQAELVQIPPGKYTYTADLEKGGQILKTNRGRLVVEIFSLEEFDQSGDRTGLMALSSITAGGFFTYDQFNEAVNSMDLEMVVESTQKEIILWNKFWLLVIFIAFLSSEWIIRKINNLI